MGRFTRDEKKRQQKPHQLHRIVDRLLLICTQAFGSVPHVARSRGLPTSLEEFHHDECCIPFDLETGNEELGR